VFNPNRKGGHKKSEKIADILELSENPEDDVDFSKQV